MPQTVSLCPGKPVFIMFVCTEKNHSLDSHLFEVLVVVGKSIKHSFTFIFRRHRSARENPYTRHRCLRIVCLFVGCLTSQQQATVSQGRICSDNFTCCHTEIEVADQTFYLTQSQYIDTGPTSPSVDLIMPGAWQGSHCSVNFEVTGMTRPRKNPGTSGIRTRDFPLSRRTP